MVSLNRGLRGRDAERHSEAATESRDGQTKNDRGRDAKRHTQADPVVALSKHYYVSDRITRATETGVRARENRVRASENREPK